MKSAVVLTLRPWVLYATHRLYLENICHFFQNSLSHVSVIDRTRLRMDARTDGQRDYFMPSFGGKKCMKCSLIAEVEKHQLLTYCTLRNRITAFLKQGFVDVDFRNVSICKWFCKGPTLQKHITSLASIE